MIPPAVRELYIICARPPSDRVDQVDAEHVDLKQFLAEKEST
jgi:hypothetical protein